MLYYIPIATSLFCIFFFIELFQHWRKHRAHHVLWWTIGIFFYGAGTVTESIHAIAGYSPALFRIWYILGALLGAAPLAQGTVYLVMKKKKADILAVILTTVIAIASILVILSPLQAVSGTNIKLGGYLLEWSFIRYITPFINVYAFIFLVGGAVYSAVLYYRTMIDKSKFWGNILIAAGGLLPGIGGMASKFGHIEVLYITEFIGICLIHAGYQMMKSSSIPSIYQNQV